MQARPPTLQQAHEQATHATKGAAAAGAAIHRIAPSLTAQGRPSVPNKEGTETISACSVTELAAATTHAVSATCSGHWLMLHFQSTSG
jgi:hypothetical protein